MSTYNLGRKTQETIAFLEVLQKHYHKMTNDRISNPVWETVLEECQEAGMFQNRKPGFLYSVRWPRLINAVEVSL